MKKILGIGSALVDILTQIPDEKILKELNLPKSSMTYVDAKTSVEIGNKLAYLGNQMASGGSAANTMSGLAQLGVEAGFLSKIGEDEIGRFFEKQMTESHVKPLMLKSETPSGRVQALVTADGERTFATYLGAALELSPDDLKPELFDGWDILYVEGYLVFNRPLVDCALEIAKSKGMKVAMDLASFNVVEVNRDYMMNIIKNSVDIVFANEEEAKALTGLEDPEASLHEIASMCDIAVVKVGPKGAYVQHGDMVVKVDPIPAKVIDTTGAGDMWAAGFMAGLVKGEKLEKCAQMGAILAANIIEVIGAKMDENRWKKIFFEIN